jgi:YesN/AraC family two-component response regulator
MFLDPETTARPIEGSQRFYTVLLVDDEPDVLESLKDVIQADMPGVRVLTASCATQALGIVGAERVDLVVTDYRMPDMDGIDMVERLRKSYPAMACVLLTAYADLSLVSRAISEARFDGVFSKPAETGRLTRFIGLALSRQEYGRDDRSSPARDDAAVRKP